MKILAGVLLQAVDSQFKQISTKSGVAKSAKDRCWLTLMGAVYAWHQGFLVYLNPTLGATNREFINWSSKGCKEIFLLINNLCELKFHFFLESSIM